MPSPPALELRDVSYEADGIRIVHGVSWSVVRGEHWAVLGPNGAGKTTLLRIAGGYIWPNAGGQVLRDGEPLVDLRRLRRRIGWVSSHLVERIPKREPVLNTVLSGKFAQLGLKPMPWDRPSASDSVRAAELLDRLGCADLIEKHFGVLSQGEQQKVLIARALMVEPLMIILDDPCAGLDPGAREKFLSTIESLAGTHDAPSLIMVTHHIEEIMPAFERTLVMAEGRIVHCGETDSVLQASVLEQLYGTKPAQFIRHGKRRWTVW